jgi:hypothetical protein
MVPVIFPSITPLSVPNKALSTAPLMPLVGRMQPKARETFFPGRWHSLDPFRLNGSYFLLASRNVGTGPRRIRTVDLRGLFNWPDVVLTFFHGPSLQKRSKGLPGPASEDDGSMRLFSAGFAVPKSGDSGGCGRVGHPRRSIEGTRTRRIFLLQESCVSSFQSTEE